jgi:hypothetical protein
MIYGFHGWLLRSSLAMLNVLAYSKQIRCRRGVPSWPPVNVCVGACWARPNIYHREQEGFSQRGVAAKNTLTTFILFVALHYPIISYRNIIYFFVTSCIALLVAIASHTWTASHDSASSYSERMNQSSASPLTHTVTYFLPKQWRAFQQHGKPK